MKSDIEQHIDALNSAPETSPGEDLGSANINDFIAFLTRVARTDPSGDLKNMENLAGIYSYLRDKINIKTADEAKIAISERKVDPKVIELWIEEGMFGVNINLKEAVDKGYPELKSSLEEKRQEIFESWR